MGSLGLVVYSQAAGKRSGQVEAEFAQRDAQAVDNLKFNKYQSSNWAYKNSTYHTAYGNKPHNHGGSLAQIFDIGPLLISYFQRVQEFQGDVKVEDARDTDRSEEAHEEGLSEVLKLSYPLACTENNRGPSE